MTTPATPAAAAQTATMEGVLPLRELTLLGTLTSGREHVAILRTERGRIVRLKLGERRSGLFLRALGDGQATIVDRSGNATTLELPR